MFPILDEELLSTDVVAGSYPTAMVVDYIRICSSTSTSCNPGDATMIFEDEFGGSGTVSQNTKLQNVKVQ
jgi:hypothetical protein